MSNLSPARVLWSTRKLDTQKLRLTASLREVDHELNAARRHGNAFTAARVEYGLTLDEVAAGWRITATEVSEIEIGLRRFLSPTDLGFALQQLWV
jgi:hypothetical protein